MTGSPKKSNDPTNLFEQLEAGKAESRSLHEFAMLVSVNNTRDRPILLSCIAPGGRCKCGEPAVVRYVGGGHNWAFDWPRCATCPGVRRAQGKRIQAVPMEYHHRQLLRLLGDEDAFIAAVRLGYRPPSYNDDGGTHEDGVVEINLDLWEQHRD